MSQELLIRKACIADLENLICLYSELNPDDRPANIDNATRRLADIERIEGSCVLVGLLKNKVVASCTLMVLPNLTRRGPSYGLIENVITSSSQQKKGFGKTVLSKAVEIAWSYNCYKVMLLTGSVDPATHRFYEKCGFTSDKTGFQIRNGISANPRTDEGI